MEVIRKVRSIAVLGAMLVLSGCQGQRGHIQSGKAQARLNVQQNCVIEVRFRSAQSYADPYNDVTLDVTFKGPGG